MIPDSLATQPIFLCVDDTMVAKAGTRFENVSKLFDHAAHNGSNYLNGHCFVSIMLCTPVWKNDRVSYLSLPLGYRMWQKKESKLELAASMIRQVMPEFQEKKQVIILCDSWYTKRNLVSIVDEYLNLDLIGNARIDSVMYAPAHTGRRGRPAKHGKRLSVETDFAFSNEKIGDYYTEKRQANTCRFSLRKMNLPLRKFPCLNIVSNASIIGRKLTFITDMNVGTNLVIKCLIRMVRICDLK